ncbi:hypothetical protein C1645_769874 [Glomus cerebriforme]|uniref:Uncharacterized protein n=1 Tax=Glomus cerebriforme TaxID=658196 RepID=A0A397SXP6_9GLOM|nr:hypothetical protein C1645_769874 [Glomus cerebriforme]
MKALFPHVTTAIYLLSYYYATIPIVLTLSLISGSYRLKILKFIASPSYLKKYYCCFFPVVTSLGITYSFLSESS